MDKPIPEAVRDALSWLRAALDCPTFSWDADQRDAAEAALTAAQQQGQAVDRERTLTAARFRAACYALKDTVEGPTGGVWRSESGERLKDRPEWVAFYNLVSDMRERGGPDPYAQPTQQGGGEVCAEDLRWCEDIAESLREAGGPTNNMRLVALNRLLRHSRTAPPSAPDRDAYEGAREDLLDWKGRALRAEATLRGLGYGGIDASEPPSAPVGVEGLPQPFGYIEPRPDLSGYEVFDEPAPRRAAIWNMHGMRKALAQTRAHYSIDADPDGIRERVADAITGALSFGAQGAHKPPAGHWLEPFWDMARAEREAPSPPTVGEATARRLDDYLGGEFDIRIGKQAAHAALVHALAQQPAAVDWPGSYPLWQAIHAASAKTGHPCNVGLAQVIEALDALATQQQESTT